MKFIAISILFVVINGDLHSKSLCLNRNATSKSIIDFCESQNGSLEFRCCFASNSKTILAIDLTDMKLNKVPDFSEFKNLTDINMIDLRLNPQLQASEDNDFLYMKSLDYLFLPKQFPCPGKNRIWKVINQTTDPTGTVCIHQKDVCINSVNICVYWNAYCVSNGPDHFLCLCKGSYYGYKCLRHGRFPKGTFFGLTTTITLVLSGFCYLTQRRNVRKINLLQHIVSDEHNNTSESVFPVDK